VKCKERGGRDDKHLEGGRIGCSLEVIHILVMDVVCESTSKAWLTKALHHGWCFWRWSCCKEILMWREMNRSFKMFVGVLSMGVGM
jgi:hypothetical protein